MASGSGWNLWMWLAEGVWVESMGVASGYGCKVYGI